MKPNRRVIRRPIITERATQLQEMENKFLFEVDRDANKIDIKRAVEALFEVDVVKVNTTAVHGKIKRMGRFVGRRPDWKKAVVTVADGQTIEYFES
ncbi:MAG: 50S ribosomal protein L23 [Gemmatimonadetes bacterium]|nr:50S ribosomal protein L23 [Gemmatimonadota bacterium]